LDQVYLYLFVVLFVKRFLFPKKARKAD